ncbi:MAG TPA: hypothetical protein VGL44_17725 [Gaiellales bacterium]
MKRRRFLGGALALPLIGTAGGRALADAPVRAAAVRSVAVARDESMAATLWGYLDHASSWDEAVADLRRYVADGNADADMFATIADDVERTLRAGEGTALEGVLGFFPGAVLMLHGLRSVHVHGDRQICDAQAAFLRRTMEVM